MGAKQSIPKQKDAIDVFIDEVLLKNKDVNCSLVPDFMEKDVYRNVLRVIIGNITEIVKSCRIEILNHVITVHIDPIEASENS